MPSRPTLGPGSGTIPGTTFFTEYETAMKGLWDASNLPLHSLGGTADNVTATCDWPLQAGFVDGMKFTITWAADNTGPMTLSINGAASVDVKSADGSALLPGDMATGTRVLLEYIGGEFRVLGGSGEGGTEPYYTVITASGTWMKPPGFADDAMVIVEAWGGGGGGGRAAGTSVAGGGGGGAYHRWVGRYADTPSTLAVTVGAGGAGRTGSAGTGTAGGGTTVGGLLSVGAGGGGAGGNGGSGGTSRVAAWAGAEGGPGDINAAWGGAGGGYSHAYTNPGGDSYFGGAGGDGSISGEGNPGMTPGGGGGGSSNNVNGGAGARGEVRIWIVG